MRALLRRAPSHRPTAATLGDIHTRLCGHARALSALNQMSSHQPSTLGADATGGNNEGAKRTFIPPGSGTSSQEHSSIQAGQFLKGALNRSDVASDPFTQFEKWYSDATNTGIRQREGCTLSTAELPSGRVSSRTLYLKETDGRGFVVYSNWQHSRKAADFTTNAQGALCFWWRELERQVRVEGSLERLSSDESQAYFDTRVRGSRIGAWASPQSQVLADRGDLERRVQDTEQRFDGQDRIPVPEFWGGMRVVPEMVEFWQGRDSRLHDRLRYTRDESGKDWKVDRLSP